MKNKFSFKKKGKGFWHFKPSNYMFYTPSLTYTLLRVLKLNKDDWMRGEVFDILPRLIK